MLHINFHDSGAKELCSVYYYGSKSYIHHTQQQQQQQKQRDNKKIYVCVCVCWYMRRCANVYNGVVDIYIKVVVVYIYVLNSENSSGEIHIAAAQNCIRAEKFSLAAS